MTVRTRAAGEKPENGVFWESAGEGEYTVADITKEDCGTEITLHPRAKAKTSPSMTGACVPSSANTPTISRCW
ncbi:hypothetical protein ACNKHV_02555 [Shigella flexneri]